MEIRISKNDIIEYFSEEKVVKTVRVLYVDQAENRAAIFDLDDRLALPEWVNYDNILSDIDQNIAKFAEKDEYAARVFNEDDLEAENYPSLKKRRNHAREIIEPLVTGENELFILIDKSRSRLVNDAVKNNNEKVESAKTGQIYELPTQSVKEAINNNNGKTDSLKITRPRVYRWLRSYFRGGMTYNALIPRYFNCGNKGEQRVFSDKKPGEKGLIAKADGTQTGVVMDERWRELIIKGGRIFYENLSKRTLQEAYDLTLQRLCSTRDKETGRLILPDPNKGEVFTFWQFCYQYKKEVGENLRRVLIARHGKRNFDVKMAPRTGTFRQSIFGPGSLYQIDATTADVYLVSLLNRTKIIGRPTIYAVIDAFAFRLVGLAIRLNSEDWMGYREALINVVEDKVKFCAEYGITIVKEDWENSPLPDELMGDRGAMESKMADSLGNGLGVHVINAAPYRPDWKGYVEQIFNQMNIRVIHHLPGAVPQEEQHGGRDYRLDSALTLYDFTQIILNMAVDFNKNFRMNNFKMDADMIADDLEPYPNDIYEWGCLNRSVPTRNHSIEEVQAQLLPSDNATVTEHGIRFENLYFTCDLAIKEDWETRAKNIKNWKIQVAFHPRKIEPIYIRFNDGNPLVPCHLKDRQSPFIGSSWSDVKHYFKSKKVAAKKAVGRTTQAKSDLRESTEKIVKNAQKLKKQALENKPRQSVASQLNSIGANKSEEIENIEYMDQLNAADESSWADHLDKDQEPNYKHIKPNTGVSLQELMAGRFKNDKK